MQRRTCDVRCGGTTGARSTKIGMRQAGPYRKLRVLRGRVLVERGQVAAALARAVGRVQVELVLGALELQSHDYVCRVATVALRCNVLERVATYCQGYSCCCAWCPPASNHIGARPVATDAAVACFPAVQHSQRTTFAARAVLPVAINAGGDRDLRRDDARVAERDVVAGRGDRVLLAVPREEHLRVDRVALRLR